MHMLPFYAVYLTQDNAPNKIAGDGGHIAFCELPDNRNTSVEMNGKKMSRLENRDPIKKAGMAGNPSHVFQDQCFESPMIRSPSSFPNKVNKVKIPKLVDVIRIEQPKPKKER